MKIVITAQGNSLDSGFDMRFGRAAWFAVIDTESEQVDFIDNQENLSGAHGVGTNAGRLIVESGAEAVVSGNIGPNAFQVLNAAGLKIYIGKGQTVKEVLEGFKQGKFEEVGENIGPKHNY